MNYNVLTIDFETLQRFRPAFRFWRHIFTIPDGLIAFVNLSSSFVQSNPEFTTGRSICDQISNYFATMRQKVFAYLQQNPSKVLAGDSPPQTQWDPAVTHLMQFLLTEAGGLTNYKITTETYSYTQVITEFSTSFIKLFFDAVACPEEIVSDVASFIQGVGQSLRASWDDRSRNYATALLGQCHEAVQASADDPNTFVYFPKVKYYYISVSSSQQEFTTSCSRTAKVTFNFQYEQYVTGLAAAVLDPKSSTYAQFTQFLNKAQGINYKDADNQLDSILGVTSSADPSAAGMPTTPLYQINSFGVNLTEYPRVAAQPPRPIQQILNAARARGSALVGSGAGR